MLDTRAEVCVAADNSCLMHIGGGLRRGRAGVRTMHLAEVLAASEMSDRGFPAAARVALADSQLRRNLGVATSTIRAKRAAVVDELPDWQELRDAGAAIKARALATLPEQLERLEREVTAAGGTVHWARDAAEANATVIGLARDHGAREVIKVKSLATDEIELNAALAGAGIRAVETDLAELIIQLADDRPSHILVPAIHRNRAEIRELFQRTIAAGSAFRRSPRRWPRRPAATCASAS